MHKATLFFLIFSTIQLTACSGDVLSQASQSSLQNAARQTATGTPPSDMPPGMGPGGPGGMAGGLPPHFEAIKAKYPELAAALEAMQELDPEARRTQMEALFTEHPEWREVMMPPQGMTPPNGSPPPGFPANGMPSASPAS